MALASIPSASSEPLPSAILSTDGISTRTLIGDWEPPDMVMLAHSEDWPETSHALLDAVSAAVAVVLLTPAGEAEATRAAVDALSPEQRERVWLPDYEVDSAWTRDYGPLQTSTPDGDIQWLDAPYSVERLLDDDLPISLGAWFGREVETVFETLDGGALASNGRGLCVSTMDYFEAQSIDLGEDGGNALLEQIGCPVLALVPGLAHEDTKHVDLFLQFLAPDLAIVARFDPISDPEDASRMDAAVAVVQRAAAQIGQPLTIVRLDSPGASDGHYRSYLNFLQVADLLLVPGYDSLDPDVDAAALDTLGRLLPDRTVVRIPADEPSTSGGSIHCLSWGLHAP